MTEVPFRGDGGTLPILGLLVIFVKEGSSVDLVLRRRLVGTSFFVEFTSSGINDGCVRGIVSLPVITSHRKGRVPKATIKRPSRSICQTLIDPGPGEIGIYKRLINGGSVSSKRMINWSFARRLTTDSLKSFQEKSQRRVRARKFTFILGTIVLPLSILSVYDRLAQLPDPLHKNKFPLLARFYIRKALLTHKTDDTDGIARDLDSALAAVLSSGLGAASPQATSLIIYATKRYLENPNTSLERFEQALAALLKKPHVGEALDEELARLEMGIDVARRLYAEYPKEKGDSLVDTCRATIQRSPPTISRRLLPKLSTIENGNTQI